MYLIPKPQRVSIAHENSSNFYVSYDTKLVMTTSCPKESFYAATYLQKEIKKYLGLALSIEKSFVPKQGHINLTIDETILTAQGYHLSVTKDNITLVGADVAGLLYGGATLRQILMQEGAGISCLTIEDYPALPNRGFYHDVTRGRIPTLETMKKLVDTLVDYKMNQLQFYVEHSFLFKEFSEVWRDDTPLTAEDVLELDAYCIERNVELIPSISTFGHLDKVLKTKSFAHLCELEGSDKELFSFHGRMAHHTIDVTQEESFDFIKKMLEEFIPLFTSKQFNICADETFDLGKGRSKAYADVKGTHEVYVEFVNKVCSIVKAHGKRPMFWGDIILENPDLYKQLPTDIICLNWDYAENVGETKAKKLHEIGATQYLCPGVHGWRHLMNRNDFAYGNISRLCTYAAKFNAIGVLNTDWGDYGHVSDPAFSIPGLIYGAAFSWNSELIDYDEINRQISVVEYGDGSKEFVAIVSRMALQEGARWEQIGQVAHLSMQLRKQRTDEVEYKKAMEQFWTDAPVLEFDECTKQIRIEMNHLQKTIAHMDSNTKSKASAHLIHGEGQILINEAAKIMKAYFTNSEDFHKIEAKEFMELAKDIETWFYYFKQNWRLNYRESEIYRVQEVFYWVADFLRELVK